MKGAEPAAAAAQSTPPRSSARPLAAALPLLGLALLSAGGLTLELSLVRVLSALYLYSYVYVVLAIAVLGIGLGAAAGTARPHLRDARKLPLWAALAGVTGFLLTALTLWGATVEARLLTTAAAALPYGFLGLALATAFSNAAHESPKLYWADLSGAGLGTIAAIPLLNAIGGIDGMLAGALLMNCAAICFAPRRFLSWLSALVATAVLATSLAGGWLSLDYRNTQTLKPIHEQLRAGGRIESSRWDAFARTDLVYRPDQGLYYLFVDGGAGSVVPDASRPELWERDIGAYPFVAEGPDNAILIGPGGGLDVVQARAGGVRDLLAVELNAASIDMVRDLGEYAGNVYGLAADTLIDEGRSALRRSGELFDVIFLSQVVAQAAEARAYALSENRVHTVEAFGDYLDHLSPGGVVALKLYDELTLTRALTTALTALAERGADDREAAHHLLALLDTRVEPPIPLLAVYEAPLSRDEAVWRARKAEEHGLALLFVPGLIAAPPLDALVEGEASVEDVITAVGTADVRPARDDWPFFFQFEIGLPLAVRPLAMGLGLLLAALVLALLYAGRARLALPARLDAMLFACLGAGFMVIEVVLLHRTQLLLGHPTLNLSVVLGALLIAGGLGSFSAGHIGVGRERGAIGWIGLLVAAAFAGWLLLWSGTAEALRGADIAIRSAATVLGLLPLAFVMGMPFPLALRAVGRRGELHVALGWAVNGVMSVVGAVGALLVALQFGFIAVAVLGGLCYLALAVLGFKLSSS